MLLFIGSYVYSAPLGATGLSVGSVLLQDSTFDPPELVLSATPFTIQIRFTDRSHDDVEYMIESGQSRYFILEADSGQTYTFIDEGEDFFPGNTYNYHVEAILKDGTILSNVAEATITMPLSPPQVGAAQLPYDESAINFTLYTFSSGGSNTEVYRSTSPDGDFELIASTPTTLRYFFTDSDVDSGEVYYYKARVLHTNPALTSEFTPVRRYTSHSPNYNPSMTARLVDPTTVEVTFTDHEINDEFYYFPGTFETLALEDSGSTVTLFDYVRPGTKTYTVGVVLTERDDYDVFPIASVSIEIPAQACEETGGMDWEIWKNVSGTGVVDIPISEPADEINNITVFETPTYYANSYGSRIRGYLCISESGYYTFWIASDDNSELWLSTDGNPLNKQRIAHVPGHTNPRQWEKYPSQQSSPIELQAGHRYYVEVLHKEGGGNDHISVGWQRPGGELERPIPGERMMRFEPPTTLPCEGTGTIAREIWRNISGTDVSLVPFDTSPATVETYSYFETEQYYDNNYGSRMRGYVCVPFTGDYIFWVAGDDNTELWLSTDEREGNINLIAHVPGHTAFRQWDKYSTQQSNPIHLEAGKQYYIEARHKEGGGNDHISVGWQLPTGQDERPIPGHRLIRHEDTFPNEPPNVTIESPDEGETIVGDAVLISANATDPDGEITSVEFIVHYDDEAHTLAAFAEGPYEFLWENVSPGTYQLNVHATDDSNATFTKVVHFTVQGTSCEGTGIVYREVWRNIPGYSIGDIPLDSPPDGVVELNSLTTQNYYANEYGSRIRGYLCAPETGEYVFYLTGDDMAELWLSPDGSSRNKALVAAIFGHTGYQEWSHARASQSVPIGLTTGQLYYFEILHKEGGGADHVSVGWQTPGATLERPIPGNRLLPLTDEFTMAKIDGNPGPMAMPSGEIRLYPNPTTSRDIKLSFIANDNSLFNGSKIEVISFTGEVVHRQVLHCDTECTESVLSLQSDLRPGMYLVKVSKGDMLFTERLVVK